MHHGGEGERGDESPQEVLNAHAQDGHTWGSEHVRERLMMRNMSSTTKEEPKLMLLSALLYFTLLYTV